MKHFYQNVIECGVKCKWSHIFISVFVGEKHAMEVDTDLGEYQYLQRKSWYEGLEKFEIVQFNPGALLFSLTSPVPFLLSFFLIFRSFLAHVQFCYQFKAQRGQRGSVSVRQVVTQMMTNWPPLRSPPNQVQTWLLNGDQWQSGKALSRRAQSHKVRILSPYICLASRYELYRIFSVVFGDDVNAAPYAFSPRTQTEHICFWQENCHIDHIEHNCSQFIWQKVQR